MVEIETGLIEMFGIGAPRSNHFPRTTEGMTSGIGTGTKRISPSKPVADKSD